MKIATHIKLSANVMGQLKEYINKEKLTYVINYLFTLDYDEVDVFNILTCKPFSISKEVLLDTLAYHYALDVSWAEEVAENG